MRPVISCLSLGLHFGSPALEITTLWQNPFSMGLGFSPKVRKPQCSGIQLSVFRMSWEVNRLVNFPMFNRRAQFCIQITILPSPSVWHYLRLCSVSISSQPWQQASNKFIFVDCGWNLWPNIISVELITGLDFCTEQLHAQHNTSRLSSQALPRSSCVHPQGHPVVTLICTIKTYPRPTAIRMQWNLANRCSWCCGAMNS